MALEQVLKAADYATEVHNDWCPGCGDFGILRTIQMALAELKLDPYRVAMVSGIGCSAKTVHYIKTYGVHTLHGRVLPVAQGIKLANPNLEVVAVGGDGDGMGIGGAHFVNAGRRNLDMLYILHDNGVYGLTKGQFSATADLGSKLKSGVINDLPPIDTCALAIMLGATYVGRSFSGDKKQLLAMSKAAIAHNGTAMLHVISPCVTFNDHEGSTKSLKNIRANRDVLHDIDFIPDFDQVEADYAEGTEIHVRMHEAGMITLHKIKDHDPRDRMAAIQLLERTRSENKFATGLIYINADAPDFSEVERLPEVPLAFMGAMTVGAGLALAGVRLPMVETGIASSVLVLGLLIAFAARLPVAVRGVLGGAVAGSVLPRDRLGEGRAGAQAAPSRATRTPASVEGAVPPAMHSGGMMHGWPARAKATRPSVVSLASVRGLTGFENPRRSGRSTSSSRPPATMAAMSIVSWLYCFPQL